MELGRRRADVGHVAGAGVKPVTTHVDDWVHEWTPSDDPLTYAKWFLFLKRLPALDQGLFERHISEYRLFATWQGKQVRVTGASRLGDVWVHEDLTVGAGYQHRVDVSELSEFRRFA